MHLAAGGGDDRIAAWLAARLTEYFKVIPYGTDWSEVMTIGAQAAARCGDHEAEGLALRGLGSAHYEADRFDEAIQYYRQAMAVQERMGDRCQLSQTLCKLGSVFAGRGEYGQAIENVETIRPHCPRTGCP
jgi:tetratricopeptide (TPR) repeat protein